MQDRITQLFLKLSATEKRYFQLFLNKERSKVPKKYSLIWDFLSQHHTLASEALSSFLKENKLSVDYIETDKNYLYNLLLEQLRAYYASNSVRIKMNNLLGNVEILNDKGLLKQARKQLKIAIRLSTKHELFALQIEALRWHRKLNPASNELILEQQKEQYEECLSKQDNYNVLDLLFRESELLRQKINKARNTESLSDFDDILSNPTLMGTGKLSSFSSQIRKLQIEAANYYSQDLVKDEYQANFEMLELFKQNPQFLQDHPIDYINIYSRYLILSKKITPEKYPEVAEFFRKIPEQLHVKSSKIEAAVYMLYSGTELTRMINVEAFEEAEALGISIEKKLNKIAKLTKPALILSLYYRMSYIYIGLEKYSKSLVYLNKIQNDFKEYVRADLYRFSRILLLIVHYKLGNFSLLPYTAKSVTRHLKNKNKLFVVERKFITLMEKMGKRKNQSKAKVLLEKFRTEMLLILENPFERKILNYFNLLNWLNREIN